MRLVFLCVVALLSSRALAFTVPGEPARSAKVVVGTDGQLRGNADYSSAPKLVEFGELDQERVEVFLKNHEAASSRAGGPTLLSLPVALERSVLLEGSQTAGGELLWEAISSGSVARIRVSADSAKAIRVGFDADWIEPRMEIRVHDGRKEPSEFVTGIDVRALASRGIFWGPLTTGQDQFVEIYSPDGPKEGSPVDRISHFFDVTSGRLPDDLKSALQCMVGVECARRARSPLFSQQEAATAKMLYQKGGGGYVCNGTLINDADPSTQIPFFITAEHCVDSQEVANTLITYWEAESPYCADSGYLDEWYVGGIPVSGGASLVHTSKPHDITLLRLNNPAPPSSYFMGWDATLFEFEPTELDKRISTLSVHHPSGENKAVTAGVQIRTVGYPVDQLDRGGSHIVSAMNGSFAGGSSGHGLLRSINGELRLYGTLIGTVGGGCSNMGLPYESRTWEPGNIFMFSRFDYWYRLAGHRFIGPDASRLSNSGSGGNLAKWNYSGLWYVPERSGWGFSVQQFQSQVLVLIYAYSGGSPEWYFVQSSWAEPDVLAGPIFRRTNPGQWGSTNFRFDDRTDQQVGNMRLEFRDRGVMAMSGSINGRPISGVMEKLE